VIGGIHARDGRVIACDFDSAGRVDIGKIGSKDALILENKFCHGLSPVRNHEAIGGLPHRQIGSRCIEGESARQMKQPACGQLFASNHWQECFQSFSGIT